MPDAIQQQTTALVNSLRAKYEAEFEAVAQSRKADSVALQLYMAGMKQIAEGLSADALIDLLIVSTVVAEIIKRHPRPEPQREEGAA